MKQLSLILIGGGDRGSCYLKYLDSNPEKFKLVGIAEPIRSKRDYLKEKYSVPEENCYESYEDILSLPKFADIAEQEGFIEIAKVFRAIASVEAEHEKRYRTLLEMVETNKVFEREEAITWQCRNCGFVLTGKRAPLKCPACAHPQAYFEKMKEIR